MTAQNTAFSLAFVVLAPVRACAYVFVFLCLWVGVSAGPLFVKLNGVLRAESADKEDNNYGNIIHAILSGISKLSAVSGVPPPTPLSPLYRHGIRGSGGDGVRHRSLRMICLLLSYIYFRYTSYVNFEISVSWKQDGEMDICLLFYRFQCCHN